MHADAFYLLSGKVDERMRYVARSLDPDMEINLDLLLDAFLEGKDPSQFDDWLRCRMVVRCGDLGRARVADLYDVVAGRLPLGDHLSAALRITHILLAVCREVNRAQLVGGDPRPAYLADRLLIVAVSLLPYAYRFRYMVEFEQELVEEVTNGFPRWRQCVLAASFLRCAVLLRGELYRRERARGYGPGFE